MSAIERLFEECEIIRTCDRPWKTAPHSRTMEEARAEYATLTALRADLATLKAENERLAPVIAAAKAQRIAADALLEAIATGARKQPHGMLAATRAATEQAVRETDPAPSAESEAT